jgi:hypothetical protein
MDSSTKRWTFTLSKFDEPFGVRFYFENFWEPTSIGVKVVLLVEDNAMGEHLHPYTERKLLGFTYVYVHDGQVNEEMDSHIYQN